MELKQSKQGENYLRLKVLIVPYGIETYSGNCIIFVFFVLIVPYGIETTERTGLCPQAASVNCTLWN